LKFKIEDEEYAFDGKLTVKEAMILQDKAGCGVNEADVELRRGNPYAIAAWMWILMRRAGKVIRWEDMLNLDIRTYDVVPDETEEPTTEATGTPPDPTQTGGTTPETGTSAT